MLHAVQYNIIVHMLYRYAKNLKCATFQKSIRSKHFMVELRTFEAESFIHELTITVNCIPSMVIS